MIPGEWDLADVAKDTPGWLADVHKPADGGACKRLRNDRLTVVGGEGGEPPPKTQLPKDPTTPKSLWVCEVSTSLAAAAPRNDHESVQTVALSPCPYHGLNFKHPEPCKHCAANRTAARDANARPMALPWCGDPQDTGCVPQHRWVSWTDSRGYLMTRQCECHP